MSIEQGATVVVILHDIRMCGELEWHRSCGLCMCLIDYTLGCLMLYVYLIVNYILFILSVTCKMKLFFFLRLTILKPTLYDHSLSYTHFVVSKIF